MTNDPRGLNDIHDHQQQQISSDYKQTQMSAAEHREKYYATVRKPMTEQQSPTGNLERIPEYSEDIYPYATFHLPDEENLSGNPMLMSRYSASSNAGTMPMSANLYNSRNSMSSVKEVRNVAQHIVQVYLLFSFLPRTWIAPRINWFYFYSPDSCQYECCTKYEQN